jgi:hypothetical protein
MANNKHNLHSLPYGSVIEYRRKRYYKCVGLDGDILMSEKEHGHWEFIFSTRHPQGVNWKQFKTLYIPES